MNKIFIVGFISLMLLIVGCSKYIDEEEAIVIANAFLYEEYKSVERIFDNWENDLSVFDYEFKTSYATFLDAHPEDSYSGKIWRVYINIIGYAREDMCIETLDDNGEMIKTCYLNEGKNYSSIISSEGEQKLGEYKKLATIEINALTGEVITNYGSGGDSRIV